MRSPGCIHVALVLFWQVGCSGRAGTYCQTDGDCRAGLICAKPTHSPADAGPDGGPAPRDGGESTSFGLCLPALRGLGEACIRSADCSPSLVCSTTMGVFRNDTDRRYGSCVVAPSPPNDMPNDIPDLPGSDGAPPDGGPTDAGPTDASPTDASPTDASPQG